MMKFIGKTISPIFVILMLVSFAVTQPSPASSFVVLSEPGLPTADSSGAPLLQLKAIFAGATFVSTAQLGAALKDTGMRLLVLPYGSAFPEEAWDPIDEFLNRGGNLLVLGGRPFTRAAYHDAQGWHLRDYSVRFTRPLMIDQYQETSGSDGLAYEANPDLTLQAPRFAWKRAFSPVIRLSAVDLYKRGGTAGSIDARLDAFAWGVKDGRRLSAPLIQIDHLRNGFDGGRWIFLNADVNADLYESTQGKNLILGLAERAAQGSEEFLARPTLPLYLPGEPVPVNISWHSADSPAPPLNALTVKVASFLEDQPSNRSEVTASLSAPLQIALPAPSGKGLYIIEAKLMEGDKLRAIYRTGFWIRDEAYLRGGPKLSVNHDYFELDGHPLAVVGTTYMSSEVQRLYFEYPNVYVWDRELGEIQGAGLNMIRTGWWTGWDKFCNENGQPYDRTLRTLEAYLMTARKHGLPVQFNFFAFLPDVLGGTNPYLDPQAVRRQQTLISSVAATFHDVPWLAWDFVNEPSISQHLWTMRPNGDALELQAWNDWLKQRHPDRAALAAAWNVPASSIEGQVALPEEIEFTARGVYVGRNSLKLYDYNLFCQGVFANWVRTMRDAVRAAGSQQSVTVGQDEGGIQDRLSPAYWGQFVDFTTNHSWWQNDFVLWDSLLAKQPGKAMLIQETGLQRELDLDEVVRRDPDSEASLLEKKVAAAFVQGSGAIEWLWNTNSYMTESNETPIGLIRPDATEKPEATVMRAFAAFAKPLQQYLRNPHLPAIAIVTSHAAQFSVIADMQLEAQRKAVRALTYYDRLTTYVVAENQLEKLGSPKLAILPSAQALTETAWQALLTYVKGGGALLVTGPVERNEDWQRVQRAAQLTLGATVEPLFYHNASMVLNNRVTPLTFDQGAQTSLDSLRFSDGATLKEIPLGNGRIFWAAYPVELAEGTQPAADLYAYVAVRLGILPLFELQSSLSPGVLVFPTVLEDSVFYVITSDSASDEHVDLRDRTTGARLTIQLKSQHAALAVLGKEQKAVVAKYGF